MTHSVHFLPEVADDAIAGYRWYESKAVGLGEDFLRMFYVSARLISANPLLYPNVHREFRRCLLRRFPYALYFKIEGDEAIVIGLFHCARNPQTVKAVLRVRNKPEDS